MELIKTHSPGYGLNCSLKAMGIPKSSYYYWLNPPDTIRKKRNRELRKHLIEAITDHPDYGLRRLLPEVSERSGQIVNHKRLRPMLAEEDLAIKRSVTPPPPSPLHQALGRAQAAGRINKVAGRTFEPFGMLSVDFTELPFGSDKRKSWLIAFVDPVSRWIPGWAVGLSANTDLAVKALQRVRTTYRRLGIPLEGTIIHQDQDSVFRSYRWAREILIEDKAVLSYSENGARGNGWIESLWGRVSVEFTPHLDQVETIAELRRLLNDRFTYYLFHRRHSGTGNQPPVKKLKAITNRKHISTELVSPD